MPVRVTIIDYGMGNIWSVRNAFSFLGQDVEVTGDPDRVARSDVLVLPGVGSFRKAMEAIRATRLDQGILEAAIGRRRKILGICLGMQLFAKHGTEDGPSTGLDLVSADVERFRLSADIKVPHVGFNRVRAPQQSRLFRGLGNGADFYFVHSFHVRGDELAGERAICNYGIEFLASYEQDNLMATQFHPEKSQTNGLLLLQNFLSI